MRAIIAIAKTTLGEAVRRRVLLIILLIALLILIIAPGLSILTPRQERTVLLSLTLGVVQATSALIAIVLTIYMIPNEIERRTIYTILSKPVQRWQFIIGKYLGAVSALGIMMGLMTLILVGVFALQQRDAPVAALLELARQPMMFFIQMSLLAAVGVFFSTFVSPIVNFFLTGGTYFLGTVLQSLFQSFSENPQVSAPVAAIAKVIVSIVPNFGSYDTKNSLISPGQEIRSETFYYLGLTGYAFVYVAILLIGAILIFDRREI